MRKKKSGWILLGCLAAAFLFVSMFGCWVMVAGLTTVKRTIQYNFSGIDDYRIFPQRRMLAAPQPFRFDGASQTGVGLRVSYGKQRDVNLAALLKTW
ncbi:MAG: hypothetical protein HY846_09530 [Nitrosomonadales bacterium]|nr:hypothetical protein [Nitrosomonadales bacterium]